jgi:transposase
MLSQRIPRLTTVQRHEVQFFRKQGLTIKQVAEKVGCGLSTVKRWCSRPYGKVNDIAGRGRKKELTSRTSRRALKLLKSGNSLRKVGRALKVSHETIRTLTKVKEKNRKKGEQKYVLYPYKALTEPDLNPAQEGKRLTYCLAMRARGKFWYKHSTFCDEKTWVLGKPPNRQNNRIWRNPNQKNLIQTIKIEKYSAKIHSFAAINYYGKSELRFYIDESANDCNLGKRMRVFPTIF